MSSLVKQVVAPLTLKSFTEILSIPIERISVFSIFSCVYDPKYYKTLEKYAKSELATAILDGHFKDILEVPFKDIEPKDGDDILSFYLITQGTIRYTLCILLIYADYDIGYKVMFENTISKESFNFQELLTHYPNTYEIVSKLR